MDAGQRAARTIEVDEELLADIRGLVRDDARISLLNILADIHAADIAELIANLDEESRRYVFSLLEPARASEVLRELDEGVREPLLAALSPEGITRIVGELASDDAADVIADLEKDVARQVLGTIEAEDAANVQRLMTYPEDTAGGIMGTEVLTVNAADTVAAAVRKARSFAKSGNRLLALYVVDGDGVLLGVLPAGDLILQSPGRRMGRVMQPAVSVKAEMDQEAVANVMRKYDLIAVPVVNERGRVLGLITVDDIVEVVQEEATEDLARMAGLAATEESSFTVLRTSRLRLPWLLLGFSGEMLSALVLKSFQASLEQIIAAAFFIPIIMAMGGNAGIQSSAIVVRGLATGDVRASRIGRRVAKEVGVAMLNGIALSLLMFLVCLIWLHDLAFGFTACIALLTVVFNASIVGSVVPFLLDRFRIDPAIATGPFITTTNDALGLLIYFGFMQLLYL